MSRFNRTNFFPVDNVNGRAERDLAKNFFNDLFVARRPMRFYSVERADLLRPDIISIRAYNKMDYWWIICRVNKIVDVWNDLEAGDIIQVPDVQDIVDFYQAVRSQLAT